MSRVAFAAFTCGFDLISSKGFQHSVSGEADTEEDLEHSRRVTWIWDGKKTATFKPIEKEETISIQEFESRFNDLQWCQDNPDHPISYMRYFLEKSRDGFAKLQSIEPTLRFVRDGDEATVPHDATEEEIDEFFDQLNETR